MAKLHPGTGREKQRKLSALRPEPKSVLAAISIHMRIDRAVKSFVMYPAKTGPILPGNRRSKNLTPGISATQSPAHPLQIVAPPTPVSCFRKKSRSYSNVPAFGPHPINKPKTPQQKTILRFITQILMHFQLILPRQLRKNRMRLRLIPEHRRRNIVL